MSDERVPRSKGTYKKLVDKLTKNDVKFAPYGDYDVNNPDWKEMFIKNMENIDINKTSLEGTSVMFFARLEDEQEDVSKEVYPSDYFKDYTQKVISDPNCTYMSMYNDLIKSGYIPKFFSVLIKDCHNDADKVKAEIFGSRVANLLGVPTAYNFGIKDKNPKPKKWTGEIVGDYFAVGSLDFVPYGYHIESFKDLNHGYYKRTYPSLMMWIDYIDTMINDRFAGNVDEECRKKVHEDFVASYLFRTILFPDRDFAVYNSGLVINGETGNFKLVPNFDMEGLLYDYTYMPNAISIFENRKRKNDIAFSMENYPEITTSFMEKLKVIVNNGTLDEVFGATMGSIETPHLKSNMNKFIRNTLDIYEKVRAKKDNSSTII